MLGDGLRGSQGLSGALRRSNAVPNPQNRDSRGLDGDDRPYSGEDDGLYPELSTQT